MKGYAVLATYDDSTFATAKDLVTTGTGIQYVAVFLSKRNAQRWLSKHAYVNFTVVEVTLLLTNETEEESK
jgi:hypothetical protein